MKNIARWGALFLLPIIVLSLLATVGSVAHATPVDPHGLGTGLLIVGSTLAASSPTLLDLAKTLNPNGTSADVVEILQQYNEVLDDAVAVEANSVTGHRTTTRTGIPLPTWTKLYQGVTPTKSTTVQVTDSFGTLANYSRVAKDLVDLAPNGAAFRLSEDKPVLEGMAQEMAQTLFYGSERTAPEEFTGLSPRYNSLTAENGIDNIINAAGAGSDNTSIWLICWGDQTMHTIFPQGSKAGIVQEDRGQQTMQNSLGTTDGALWEAYVTHYQWKMGFCLRDWRYAVRICNIDVSDLNTLANTKLLVQWMTQATERIPSFNNGRAAFYLNRNIREKLRLGILEKITSQLTWETVAGKRVMRFDGIPVRRVDQLVNTEAVVS